jgi:hypothetical protein
VAATNLQLSGEVGDGRRKRLRGDFDRASVSEGRLACGGNGFTFERSGGVSDGVRRAVAAFVDGRQSRLVGCQYEGDDESFQKKQSDILRLFDERDWNELTEFATGEKLDPKAFAEDFRP